MSSLKILIVCEDASNVFGGEAMLPLNYFRLLEKTEHEVYLVTHERVKSTISKIEDINQDRIFYVPDTKVHKLLYKYSKFFPERIRIITFGLMMHWLTQYYQRRLAKKVIESEGIDVIHEPSPVSAVQPSAMFALGVPVIIGPMNGGMSFPEAFQYMASRTERVLYKVMRISASVYNLFIPGKLFAKVLLVANQRTKNTLPKFRFGKVIQVVENGVFSTLDSPKPIIKKNQINVVYLGRLVDWKAVDIVIKAIATCKENVKLTIVGDGPLRQALTDLAEKIAPNKVEFLGLVPHKEIDAVLENADISVLPSVREAGGAVVLEAMSRGLPVIASNWGGPADYITSASGFLVYPKSEEFMIESFANTIDQLAAQPDLRFAIGIKAIEHVKKHFLWETKIKEIIEIYHLALKA